MASSNNTGFGNGQNGYSAEFGSYNNEHSQKNTVGHFPKVNPHQQQQPYYPAINPNAPNAPNPTVLNHQQHQHVYSCGLSNIAPRTVNQCNQYNNSEQRQFHPSQYVHKNVQLPPIRQTYGRHHYHLQQQQQQFPYGYYLSADPQSIMLDHQYPLPPRHYLDPNPQPIMGGYASIQSYYQQPQGINQISNDSPQNFQVPSIAPTQNSNDSGVYSNNLFDLTSPQYSAAVKVQQKYRKPLDETNDEELAQILDECNFNPEFPMTDVFVAVNETYQTFDDSFNMLITDNQQQQLGAHESNTVGTNDNLFMHASEEPILPRQQQSPPTVNLPQIPLEESDMEEDETETENVEANEVSALPSSASTKNPVGRPPKYKTKIQRQEAHKADSRISYRVCRERKAEYLRNLKAIVESEEAKNRNLREKLTMLKDDFIETFNADSGFFTEEEIDWALNILNENSQ